MLHPRETSPYVFFAWTSGQNDLHRYSKIVWTWQLPFSKFWNIKCMCKKMRRENSLPNMWFSGLYDASPGRNKTVCVFGLNFWPKRLTPVILKSSEHLSYFSEHRLQNGCSWGCSKMFLEGPSDTTIFFVRSTVRWFVPPADSRRSANSVDWIGLWIGLDCENMRSPSENMQVLRAIINRSHHM